MAGKVGSFKICEYNFTFVFRHRFEKKKDENDIWDRLMEWREWKLGFWYKRIQVVGKKNFNKPSEWKNHYSYEYMFGINLLWCKAWMTVQKGAMNIKLN